MEYRILGPLEVAHEGRHIPLGAAKERALLVRLLLDAGRVVSVDRLVEDLWEGEPPGSANVSVRVHVSRIRKALAAAGAPEVIVTAQTGYRLAAAPEEFDVARFEGLLARGREELARGDAPAAATTLADALGLWRGRALADVADTEFGRAEAARLEESRLGALEDKIEADLACGRHGALVGELEALTAAHPLRERLWGQRMVALYRSGRQADALAVYQKLRSTLVDELGIEPSPEVARLEQQILAQDPTLEAPASGRMPATVAPEHPSGVVTFLLTDIEGSTRLWDTNPDAMAEALERHDALVAEVVAVHDGHFLQAKGEGDSTMSVFGRASDGAAAAFAVHDQLQAESWPGDLPIRVRIGIHTGEAHERGGDYFGPAVNRTARIRSLACGGQVLVSQATAELIRDRPPEGATLVDFGRHELKGLARAEQVFELGRVGTQSRPAGPRDAAERLATLPLPSTLAAYASGAFVGREAELARLQAIWKEVEPGERRAIFIAGEPGIGKTRLVAEFAAWVHRAGAFVLYGRLDEETILPYKPYVEALRESFAAFSDDDLRTIAPASAAELTRLVPELAQRLPELPKPISGDPEGERYRLFEAIVDTSIGRPATLTILDDLHWADKPTLLLLKHLLRSAAVRNAMVLGTYRETELTRTHPLAETLADLRRESGFERILLKGLQEPEVGTLIGSLTRTTASEPLTRAVFHETDGNPFFIGEVVRHLRDAGIPPGASEEEIEAFVWRVGIPEGIREVIGRRLSRLSEECNEILRTAAVIGRESSLDVLAAAANTTVERVIPLIEEAASARIVAEVLGRVGRYAFVHTLIREALYQELSAARRAHLHGRVGQAIESVFATNLNPHLAELAHHFLQAIGIGDPRRAVDYSIRAARRAEEMLAYEEAVEHYRRAAQTLEIQDARDDELYCDVLTALGVAQRKSGDVPGARETILHAVAVARALGSAERLAGAVLSFSERLEYISPMSADYLEEYRQILEEAAAALGDEDSVLRVRVLARLAGFYWWTDKARAEDLSQQALEMAGRIGDKGALAYALAGRRLALWNPDLNARLALAENLLDLAIEIGDKEREFEARHWRAFDLLESGRASEAARDMEEYARQAAEMRQPIYLRQVAIFRAMQAALHGRFADAESRAREAADMGEREGDPDAQMLLVSQLAWIWRFRGELAAFEPMITEAGAAQKVYAAQRTIAAALSLFAAEIGRLAEARRLFETAFSTDLEDMARDVSWMQTVCYLAETCSALGDGERAASLHRLLEPFADRIVVQGPPILACLWPVSYYLGLLDETRSQLDEALSHYEEALSQTQSIGGVPLAAHVEHALARALIARGQPRDHERAQVLLSSALATAEELGMPPLAAKVRALQRPPLPSALAATDVFVGRSNELDRLRTLWAEASAGRRRVVFVTGEPGIGKTRLTAEFATEQQRAGAVVLFGRSDEEPLVPYQPFVEAVRSFVASSPADLLRSVVSPTAGEITRLVPELARRFPDLPEPIAGDPEGERYRLFEAFGDLLTAIARAAPVSLVLDDLHWADKPTLLLLKHLLRRDDLTRVLFVGTYRETELARTHPLAETLADLRRDDAFERVSLRGLEELEVGALLDARMGDASSDLTRVVHHETEGNPFFVVEVIRHLQEASGDAGTIGIPQGVKEVIGRRLSRLSDDANTCLGDAAVIGREFRLDVVERASSIGSERLLAAMEEAASAGIVTEVPGEPDHYAFSHALVRQTVYEELSASRRVRLHRAVGEAIESLHAGSLQSHLAELAHHFTLAAHAGDTEKAIDFALRAGDQASAFLAYEEAVEHYRCALQSLGLEENPDPRKRCSVLLALGRGLTKAGDQAEVKATALLAAEAARSASWPEGIAEAALTYFGPVDLQPATQEHEIVVPLLEEAERMLPEGSPLLAKVLACDANAYWWVSQDRIEELSARALEVARRSGDSSALIAALTVRRLALFVDPTNERLRRSEELLRLSRDAGNKELELRALRDLIFDYVDRGDIASADREIATYTGLAEELRQPSEIRNSIWFRASSALLHGRVEEGERLAREARDIGLRHGHGLAKPIYDGQLSSLWYMQGRIDLLRDASESNARDYVPLPITTAAMGLFQSALGDREKAREAFESLAHDDFRDLSPSVVWLCTCAFLSETCVFLGDIRRAKILYELLLPYAGRVVQPGGIFVAVWGPVAHYLGLLAATMGRLDEAEHHFAEALRLTEAMDAPLFAAAVRVAYARALQARGSLGDVDRAAQMLEEAIATAEPLALTALMAQARELLRPPFPAGIAIAGDTPFVGREQELDRLTSLWSEAAGGAARAVLISGEPGIGKTRLAAEIARRAHADGALVLYGRSDEDAGVPNQPFVEALSSYIARCSRRELDAHVARFGGDLARLVPELGRRIGDAAQPAAIDPEFERYRVFEAVTGLLSDASKQSPIVLVLDDLHWATRPTLLLLRHILRSDAPLRLLVVGTYRETDLDRAHPLAEALTEFRRDHAAERIPLTGFDEQGVYEFIEASAGHTLDDVPAARDFARALHAETEGNPFFIREVLSHLAESGKAYQTEGRWTSELSTEEIGLPQGVREAVARRLSLLSESTNKALAVAAVAGTTFSVEVLERVPEADPSTLLDALDEATRVGLLVETETPGGYRFAHALVRQTLATEISSIRRIRLHRGIAEAMEQIYERDPDPYLPELARHFFEAAQGGDVAKAVDYSRRAGEQAMTRVAYEEAAEHFRRALEALWLTDADDERRADLLLALGEADARRGDIAAAKDCFREAAELARKIGSPDRLARAALGYGVGAGIGLVPLPPDRELTALIEEALEEIGPEDSALRVRLLARLTSELAEPKNASRLEATSREAVEIAERLGDRVAQFVALEARSWASMGPDSTEEHFAAADRLLRIAEELGDGEMAMRGRHVRLWSLFQFMRMEETERELDTMARLAHDLRQPLYRWLVVAIQASLAIVDGRFNEGDRLAGEALLLGQRALGEGLAAVASGVLYYLKSFWQGNFEEASSLIAPAMEYMPAWHGGRLAVASTAAWAGNLDMARPIFEELAADNFAGIARDSYWASTMSSLVAICANLGDARRAAILYEMLLPDEGRGNVSGGPLTLYSGPMDTFIGMTAATMGRWDEAQRRFDSVLRLSRANLPRIFPVQIRLTYARMFLARNEAGDRERAKEQLTKVISIAEEVGAGGWADLARSTLATAGA